MDDAKESVEVSRHRIIIEGLPDGEIIFSLNGNLPVLQTLGVLQIIQDVLLGFQKQAMAQQAQQTLKIMLPNGIMPRPRF